MRRREESGRATGGETLKRKAEGVAEGEGEEGGARHLQGYRLHGGWMLVRLGAAMNQARKQRWTEATQTAGAVAFLLGAATIPVLALAAVFWLLGGAPAAAIVLVLGLPIPALMLLLTVWGYARHRWVRSSTGVELDEAAAVIRFRGFRERLDGRVVGRVPERAVPARSIRAVRRTTHGPNWDATIVWEDEHGRERQVLVDEDRLPAGRLSDVLAERLGLRVETRND